jgi:hypothetical protein
LFRAASKQCSSIIRAKGRALAPPDRAEEEEEEEEEEEGEPPINLEE